MEDRKITMGDDPRVYDLKEVAQILSVSNRTLLRYIDSGKLKATKLGKKYIVTKESLEKLIRDGA